MFLRDVGVAWYILPGSSCLFVFCQDFNAQAFRNNVIKSLLCIFSSLPLFCPIVYVHSKHQAVRRFFLWHQVGLVVLIMVQQDPSLDRVVSRVFLEDLGGTPSPSHRSCLGDEALINAKDRVPLARIQAVFPSSWT